jgi:hypothetical protein
LTLDYQEFSSGVRKLQKSLETCANFWMMREGQDIAWKMLGKCIANTFPSSSTWGSKMHPGKPVLLPKIGAVHGQERLSK